MNKDCQIAYDLFKEIEWGLRTQPEHWQKRNGNKSITDVVADALTQAHKEGFEEARKKIIALVSEIDPLNAKCEWEDGDKIGYAVQILYLEAIEKLEREEK